MALFSCNIEHEPYRYVLDHYNLHISKIFQCTFSLSNPRNGVHHHQCYEVCLATEGYGSFHCGGGIHTIEPGMLFLASPNVDHEIIGKDGGVLKLDFFTFAISPAYLGGEVWTETDGIIDRFVRDHRTVARNCDYLAGFTVFQQGYQQCGGVYAAKPVALVLMLDCLQALSVMKPDESTKSDQPLANRFATYINDHIQSDIGIDDLCRFAQVSQRTLYMLFAVMFRVSPVRYINKVKIDTSIGYLNMGFSVKTVADLLGFADLSSFSRLFKKVTGRSPRQYLAEQCLAEPDLVNAAGQCDSGKDR